MNRAFILVALALSSCRHAGAVPDCSAPRKKAALSFEYRGQPFPLPLVKAKVAGVPTLALVDSGSESHILSLWLARKLDLPLAPTQRTTKDASGKPLTIQVAERVALEVEGFGHLPQRPTMVIDIELLEHLAIGLIVSPQYMVGPDEAMVIDLPGEALWREPEACAFSASRFAGDALAEAAACTDPNVATGYLHYVVPASIDGLPASLLLDTGGDGSHVTSTSKTGQALLGRYPSEERSAQGAGGVFAIQKLPSVEVKAGAAGVMSRVRLIPWDENREGPACSSDGALGMDFLRHCTLVLSHSRAAGTCQAPPPSK